MEDKSLFSLEGKVVIVTGGTGILGGAFVKAIAKAGGVAVILGRNEKIAVQRTEEIIASGGKAFPVIANVLEETDLIVARDLVLEKYGSIDGLVNAQVVMYPKVFCNQEQIFFR